MKRLLNVILAVMAFSTLPNGIVGAPVLTRSNLIKTAKFLKSYGYFDFSKAKDTAGANDPTSPVFVNAVKNLQWFGAIPVTGKLDRRTLELINTTRCGVKDHRPPSARGQHSIGEFNLHGSHWNKMDLTFKIINFTNDGIPLDEQREIFRRSLRMWEAASGLRIREVFSGNADILISFVREKHGDDYPFDRKGGTLAHAFYPLNNEGLAGDAHFDDDEEFTTRRTNGVNLDWVAVHEFGHSLGLLHSNVRESIMFPWYKGYVPNIKLTDDDIQGIQERYGKPSSKHASTTATTTETPTTTSQATTTTITTPTKATTTALLPRTSNPAKHPACHPNVRYDAVFVGADRLTYFITGDFYWTVDWRLKKRERKNVAERWAEVDTPVDAAYRNPRGMVVFFKGSRFWEYDDPPTRLQRHGKISVGYVGLPRNFANMDAIFHWKRFKKTYIFRGRWYWRYNEKTGRIDRGFPRTISRGWTSRFPSYIDAVTTWLNNRVYIFKEQTYNRLKITKKRGRSKVHVDYIYPKWISRKWMKCSRQVTGRLEIGALDSEP